MQQVEKAGKGRPKQSVDERLIQIDSLSKSFPMGSGEFMALKNINLNVGKGEFLAVVGKSGSGKSTLINMISGIDRPTSGRVNVDGTDITKFSEGKLTVWRGQSVGVVFQFFQLLPTLTVLENVMLPMDFTSSFPARERRERAMHLLETVGISDQADKLPSSLSGGQQQRAAIARALVNDPPLLVADEPTGNLDEGTSADVLELFANLAASGKTLVIATHEREIDRVTDRIVWVADGLIVGHGSLPTTKAGDIPKEVNIG